MLYPPNERPKGPRPEPPQGQSPQLDPGAESECADSSTSSATSADTADTTELDRTDTRLLIAAVDAVAARWGQDGDMGDAQILHGVVDELMGWPMTDLSGEDWDIYNAAREAVRTLRQGPS